MNMLFQSSDNIGGYIVEDILGKDGAEMVLIPAGAFEMGTDSAEIPQLVQRAKQWYPDAETSWFEIETPRHTVHLDAFYMDKYEVTNAQYAQFLNDYGKNTDAAGHALIKIENSLIEESGGVYRPKKGYENHPVICISWYGAAAYAQFYGKRLPTEAEWEKAARGGLVGKKFPWGDSDPDGTNANFADKNTNCDWSDKKVDDGYERTAPVGSYTPNGYGLYDMAGNVWEWCADEYDKNYYSKSPKDNPTGHGAPVRFVDDDFTNVKRPRVLRGGSWNDSPLILRCAIRLGFDANDTGSYLGFRCSQDF